jgi:hypothetical protein
MSYGTAMAEPAYASDDRQMKSPKKTKRPGFLARWFLKKLVEGAEYEKRQRQEYDTEKSINRLTGSLTIGRESPTIDQPERAIQFTVYNASGGRVVETRRYDKKTDRHTNGLYVINNDVDFGKEIDKIITMEVLR